MSAYSISPEIARAVSNDHLQLIVNPTERCNLRCSYCYETFVLKKMPAAVISGILNLVQRRAQQGLKTLQLDFFGGEPLAAWDVVAELTRGLSAICRKHATEMFGGMTTNGVLLDRSRLDFLVAHDLRALQITLDGPPAVHDRRRITRQGSGTFDAVWAALQIVKDSPHRVNVLIRMHFDPTSLDLHFGDAGFVSRVVTQFARGDDRFRLHFHALGRWGGPNDKDIQVFQSPIDERAAVEQLVGQALTSGCLPKQLVQYSHDAAVGESGHAFCYAAHANAFVIRSNGKVAKCTVAFEDERNCVGELTEGGDLIIDQSRHLPWLQGLISGDPLALSCPALVYLWGKGGSSSKAA
jgi:uncharacterized protein